MGKNGKADREPAEQVVGDERQKALDTTLGQIEKQFGQGAVMKMGDKGSMSIEAVPTGALALDLALGVGGIPRGRVAEIFGPEGSGKTTLAGKIITWQNEHMSGTRPGLHFHDHFTIPNTEMNAESRQWFVKAPPQIKEMYQRFMITYHMQPDAYQRPDWHHLGFFIEEAVYAPLYYGYVWLDIKAGFRREEGQRTKMARQFCLLYTSPSPRDATLSRMPSSA